MRSASPSRAGSQSHVTGEDAEGHGAEMARVSTPQQSGQTQLHEAAACALSTDAGFSVVSLQPGAPFISKSHAETFPGPSRMGAHTPIVRGAAREPCAEGQGPQVL